MLFREGGSAQRTLSRVKKIKELKIMIIALG
jgi:hypothetical protein